MAIVEILAADDVADETNGWVQGDRLLIGIGRGDPSLAEADVVRWWIVNVAGYVCDVGEQVTYTRDFEP